MTLFWNGSLFNKCDLLAQLKQARPEQHSYCIEYLSPSHMILKLMKNYVGNNACDLTGLDAFFSLTELIDWFCVILVM